MQAQECAHGKRALALRMRRASDAVTRMQHDAPRGQICLLARDLGHTFSGDETMRMRGWRKGLVMALGPAQGRDRSRLARVVARDVFP